MTTCQAVYQFLSQITARNVTAPLTDADLELLRQYGIVQMVTQDMYHNLETNVAALDTAQQALNQETAQRVGLTLDVETENRRTHSVLFHFESKEKQSGEVQREQQDEARLHALDEDLAKKQRDFAELVAQRSLRDTLTPCGAGYVGFTALGVVATRKLGLALYRAGDAEFTTYWAQAQQIQQEMDDLAASASGYYPRMSTSISGADPSQLWGISIGLGKAQPDPAQGAPSFVGAYDALIGLSTNVENRLMSAEIVVSKGSPVDDSVSAIRSILKDLRNVDLPAESALGVASILWIGQRADGTIALPNLQQFLSLTRSYESAALLAILNVPFDQLSAKFQSLRAMFGSWGYRPSEDVELSSAYLAVSELPADGISTKLGILAKGLSTYLEYPLVAASVLASLGTLEANETLNYLGEAYDVIGRRATELGQSELICLAVRMLHGIRDDLLRPLDATAAIPPATPSMVGRTGFYGPHFFYVPIIVAHNAYYSTYSGVSGVHPGHIHGFGGGGGGMVG